MHEAGDGSDRVWSRGRDALAASEGSLDRAAGPRGPVASDQRFTVGKVLATGFAVWFRNLIPFLLITALFYAPPWIWAASVARGEQTNETLLAATGALTIASVVTMLINVFVAATLTYGVVMELNGQRASIGACMATGLARFLPALGVGLLCWLCIGLASLALFVPGLIVLCMLYVATTVSVIEKPGIIASLSRSSELTEGRRWSIFGLVLLVAVVNWLSVQLVEEIAVSDDLSTMEQAFDSLWRLIYLSFAHQVLTGSISAVMTSVSYYHLRVEKEGTSAADLAAIFD